MTRQEEIDKAKHEFYNNMLRDGFLWAYDKRDCFEEGAKWADANRNSLWVCTKVDLPCNHKELISPDDKRDTKYVVAKAGSHIILSRMYKIDGNWYWEGVEPDYWMAVPEPPTK